jgi:hypothetical protein
MPALHPQLQTYLQAMLRSQANSGAYLPYLLLFLGVYNTAKYAASVGGGSEDCLYRFARSPQQSVPRC